MILKQISWSGCEQVAHANNKKLIAAIRFITILVSVCVQNGVVFPVRTLLHFLLFRFHIVIVGVVVVVINAKKKRLKSQQIDRCV